MKKRMNPRSLANLKPQQPGQPSINPKGRPRGCLSINTRLEQALLSTIQEGRKKGMQVVDVIIEEAMRRAKKGDQRWAQYIFDRLEPILEKRAAAVQVNIGTAGQDYAALLDAIRRGDDAEIARLAGVEIKTISQIPKIQPPADPSSCVIQGDKSGEVAHDATPKPPPPASEA